MNWDLVKWVAGVLLTFVGIKFVFVLIHTVFSKKTMKSAIEHIGSGAGNAAERFSESISSTVEKYRARRAERQEKKQEENRPEIIIR